MIAAIVPCGGQSTRMGRPKLVLPVGGEPLIARVVRALQLGGVDRVVVVAPPRDREGSGELIEVATRSGAEVVVAPAPTPDMRATFELGLSRVAEEQPPDAVLLTPGDSPGLSGPIVGRILDGWREDRGRIVVPCVGGRRGHPLVLPWAVAQEVPGLPEGVGVNALLDRHADQVRRLELADAGILADLDTPEDYRRWR